MQESYRLQKSSPLLVQEKGKTVASQTHPHGFQCNQFGGVDVPEVHIAAKQLYKI